MIKAEKIPDEVVDAMLESIGSFFNREEARAACAAMLNAWPDAEWDRLYKGSAVQLILPLPEVANDQA